MRFPFLHKYARRIVAWLNEPSYEECDKAKREHTERQERRQWIANRMARALVYPPSPCEYLGRDGNYLFACKNEIERLAKTDLYTEKNIKAHEELLKKALDAFASMPTDGAEVAARSEAA